MKKTFVLTLSLLLVTSFLAVAQENEDNDDQTKIKLAIGGMAASTDGSLGKVGKYLPLPDAAPLAAAKIEGLSGTTYFNLTSLYRGDVWDMNHALDLDFNRIVDLKLDYTSLMHRLGNDPLTNMDTASLARSGVFHQNFSPDKQYRIDHYEFSGKATLRIPQASFLNFYAGFRNQHREGEYQARTLSKCATCHIVAKDRPINNNNQDFSLGSEVRLGKATIDYSYTKRQYRENEAAPTNTYLKVQHPELVSPVFTSRIQYGDVNGALPFDEVPDTDKDTHLIKATVPLSQGMTLSGHYISSSVENQSIENTLSPGSNIGIDTSAFAAGFSTLVGRRGVFNARFSRVKIENDDYFVDIVEPVDVAGPKVGLTYAQGYPTFGEADWTRKSALNRTTLDFDAAFKYRFTTKIRGRFNYEFKQIDRDNYQDLSLAQTTSTHTFKGRFDLKPSKQLKFVAQGTIKLISDPFTNMFAGVAPELQDWNPGNPFAGLQFYDFHRAREAHLTSQPTDMQEVKGILTWSPSYRVSLSADARIRWEKNDELNFGDWSNTTFNPGVNLWFAPTDKIDVTATYYFYGEKLDSLFAIPVLEGCGGGIIGGFPGTLTDQIDYDIDTHTTFVNLNYRATETFSLYGNLSYNKSMAKMANLQLNTSQLDFIPQVPVSLFDFEGLPEVVDYSDLEMKQLITEVGGLYNLNSAWAFKGSFSYFHYDDLAPFLYDETGKAYAFYLAAIYTF